MDRLREYNMEDLYVFYDKNGEVVKIFVYNNSFTKIKDIETGAVFELSNNEDYESAVKTLFINTGNLRFEKQQLHICSLLSMCEKVYDDGFSRVLLILQKTQNRISHTGVTDLIPKIKNYLQLEQVKIKHGIVKNNKPEYREF